jgi:glycosyltransferase involved in cell wall biosynthesis
MKIAHIVASIESEAAGPSYSVPAMCRGLAGLGGAVELLSLGAPGELVVDGVVDRRFAGTLAWLWPARRLGLSVALDRALAASRHAVWHMHGLWMMPNVYPARRAAGRDLSLLLSPRGMMSPEALRFSAARKRLFWKFLQSRALDAVDCFHATAPEEAEAIRALGFAQPVAVIPNGIDLPPPAAPSRRLRREVLSLGRIHPKKGLDRLVAAWARLEPTHPEWRLRIVGPDEGGHAAELTALAASLRLTRVSIEPPVFGAEKWRLMQEAELFVLPTLNENFAMTVAESLACATPVISTKGAPWPGLVDEGCGWWIDHGVEPLVAALGQAMGLPPERLAAMGRSGRAWMERDFGWDGVSRRMMAVYAWLRGAGERPADVRLD